MYFDPMYFLFIAPAFIFSLWASWRTKANFKIYSKVSVSSGMSGAEAARRKYSTAPEINDVQITRSRGGMLSDHYNPIKKNLALSDGVFDSRSLAAVGIAAHEAGPCHSACPDTTAHSSSARCWCRPPASAPTSATS